jgi:hypothetical protein
MSPRILLFWYLKPWCIKTFPPRLPDINLAGMITNFIYEGGRLIRLFMPKLGIASVNHDRNSLRRYRSWHVSMYLHVTIFMTFWHWQSWEMKKKYLQIPISTTFFQFLDHLNRRLIWAHLASVVCLRPLIYHNFFLPLRWSYNFMKMWSYHHEIWYTCTSWCEM